MSSISQNITRLQAAKSNIKDAINAKGGTLTDNDGFEEFPQAILDLAGQSGTITPSNIKSLVEPNTTAYNLARLVDAKIDIKNAILAKGGTVTTGDGLEEFPTDIASIPTQTTVVYGFHIDSSKSDPSQAVTYLEDAVGMTPAAMNYSTGVFNYGDWENAFFMPKPCMLYSNGTVAYYLDPNDYTKKADGTTSDIANTSFDGNAMMEWGKDGQKIWYKIVPDSGNNYSASIYISNEQVDTGYHAYNFIKPDGVTYADHFYTAIYKGYVDSNDKIRSISGISKTNIAVSDKTLSDAITSAKKNGTGWNVGTYGDRELITLLLVLISKSLNTSSKFGMGNVVYQGIKFHPTGSMNNKGLFWGKQTSTESDTSGVKVFGIEDYWGNGTLRVVGLSNNTTYGGYSVKYAYGTSDGSSTIDYGLTGYKTTNIKPDTSGSTSSLLRRMNFSLGYMLPVYADSSASESTYYCDWFAFSKAYNRTGYPNFGRNAGAFCMDITGEHSSTSSHALSYR